MIFPPILNIYSPTKGSIFVNCFNSLIPAAFNFKMREMTAKHLFNIACRLDRNSHKPSDHISYLKTTSSLFDLLVTLEYLVLLHAAIQDFSPRLGTKMYYLYVFLSLSVLALQRRFSVCSVTSKSSLVQANKQSLLRLSDQYKQNYVKMVVLASILISTVGFVLS